MTTPSPQKEKKMNKEPKAFPGQHITFIHPRSGDQETGEVNQTETSWQAKDRFWHSYRVCLHRRSAKGNRIHLHIGDEEFLRIVHAPKGENHA